MTSMPSSLSQHGPVLSTEYTVLVTMAMRLEQQHGHQQLKRLKLQRPKAIHESVGRIVFVLICAYSRCRRALGRLYLSGIQVPS